jgi:hypothetical protein
MPFIKGFDLLAELPELAAHSPGRSSAAKTRLRAEALTLIEDEGLVEAAYNYAIVILDRPAARGDQLLYLGGTALPAAKLIPESGQLTALACAVATIGTRIDRRISDLFAEKRASLALALDAVGNQALFAVTRVTQDLISAEVSRRNLSMAGELRSGDPGLDLDTQQTVLDLAKAEEIAVRATATHMMTPLKSLSMVLGVGIGLPAATWSRCDQCPSRARGKCQLMS